MTNFIFGFLLGTFLLYAFTPIGHRDIIKGLIETGYANGQADAINGDVRIRMITDTSAIFTISPWNNGTATQLEIYQIK